MSANGRNEKRALIRARSRARRLAMQGLYQWQLTAQPVKDIIGQLRTSNEYDGVDPEYFSMLMNSVGDERERLDELLAASLDRPPEQLDPVTQAILWCATIEIHDRPDIPTAVAINEAVELARRFGPEDGYKFVNAVLDNMAGEHAG